MPIFALAVSGGSKIRGFGGDFGGEKMMQQMNAWMFSVSHDANDTTCCVGCLPAVVLSAL